MAQVTFCSNLLVKADNYSSYVPFLSTAVNLVDLFQKCVVMPRMQEAEIWNSHYYTHLDQKSIGRCIGLLVPILGNILVAIYDFANRKWDDKAYVLDIVKANSDSLWYTSPRLKNDEEVVLAAIEKYTYQMRHASDRLKNDKKFILAAVQTNGKVIEYAAKPLQEDRDVVLAAIAQNGSVLKQAVKFNNDKEIVSAALKHGAYFIEFAGNELKNDREFMFAAIQSGSMHALVCMGDTLKNDKDAMLALVRQNGPALKHVGDQLKKDADVVSAAIEHEFWVRCYASPEILNDKKVLLAILKHSPWELMRISKEIRDDKEFMLALVKQNGPSILRDMNQLRDDKEFMLTIVKLDPWALEYASFRLRRDPDVIAAAAEKDGRAAKMFQETSKIVLPRVVFGESPTVAKTTFVESPSLNMKTSPLKPNSDHSIFTGPAPIYSSDKAAFEANQIKTVIALLEPEKMNQYNLFDFYAKQDIKVVHFPIQDYKAPSSPADVLKLTEEILEHSKTGNIYVHCHAGKGRTGTIMACLAKKIHPEMSADEVIRFTRKAIPGAIETEGQEKFVKAFSGEQ